MVVLIIACVVLLLFGALRAFSGVLVDYWWFGSVGYRSVYTRILLTKILLWAVGLGVGTAVAASGFLIARRISGPVSLPSRRLWGWGLSPMGAGRVVLALFWLGAVLVGLTTGSAATVLWHRTLLFLNRVPFGTADPLFGKDVGFYVFTFPMLALVRRALQVLVWASFMMGVLYYLVAGVFVAVRGGTFPGGAVSHLARTMGVIFLLMAAGYWLDRYELLYRTDGLVFGAGYVDVHARLPGYWVMLCASVAVAGILFTVRSVRQVGHVGTAVAVWVGCWVLALVAYPSFLQWFRVGPNQLAMETPYIKNNIEQTLRAYDLDRVRQVQYPGRADISHADIQAEQTTIDNVRLWDWRPLRAAYRQIQGIRTYYEFAEVDVDRYELSRGYTETMLSLRELDQSKLPAQAQTWINQRLQYTHGYGLCMSPVNERTEKGLPVLLVKNIPPVGPPDLPIEQPAIYYGEKTTGYVFVNTDEREFDYPMGDRNVVVRYSGKGGVRIGSAFRRLVFAMRLRDMKILLSDDLNPDSRIMYHRLISERISMVAPYLRLDSDPYAVLHAGRIFWIQDGYTVTDLFPYSDPSRFGGFNYIRNSVKVVLDAYDGTMAFYVADADDPLIRAYARTFPGVYRPLEEMPAGLRKHLRYPEDLFNVQVDKFSTYHMEDPRVFYNKEDVWEIPTERYADQDRQVESYYVIMRLPDGDSPEFIIMLPLTPRGKANMIAWLAGRCDGENYGELVAYRFPKGKIVYGPSQVEAVIDQDSRISQQLTLWSQRGSRVIRGNLLAIPIAGGVLYVEPLYIQAEGGGAVPQLKRVIVAIGGRAAMAPTLEGALEALFTGTAEPPRAEAAAPQLFPPLEDLGSAVEAALAEWHAAQEALKQADWGAYGEHMRRLEERLRELQRRVAAGADHTPEPESAPAE